MMSRLLLLAYYGTRALALARDRVAGRLLENFLRRKAAACGSVHISGPGRFICVGGLRIGQNVGINAGAYWGCEGGLTIGDNCRFARDVTIYTRNHSYHGKSLPYDDTNVMRPVTIGANVWVGINVTILPGATIGDGAIIGAGSVIHGTVPPRAIVGANGYRQLGERDEAHYQQCLAEGRISGFHGRLPQTPADR